MDTTAATPTLRWTGDSIEIIDQTRLPGELVLIDVRDVASAVDAIERLAIRGAPALGAFGALALVVGLDEAQPGSLGDAGAVLERFRTEIGDARPTAVNLRWAVDRTIDAALAAAGSFGSSDNTGDGSASEQGNTGDSGSAGSVAELRRRLLDEALAIGAEDARACAEIGRFGRELLADATVIATHCNAGRLATAGTGTALGVVYAKAAGGEPVRVLAAETRPLLQGARLTAWELADAGIDVSVVADAAMASLIAGGAVDAVVVGADRIAANGDTANKVGTLAHALAAADAGIGFYVAAPTTTIDAALPSGECIAIEQRNPDEVHHAGGTRLTPTEAVAINPAFDVTPARLITAIITDAGVLRPPYDRSIAQALAAAGDDMRESVE
ncbi:S-methyl-5-thioribose-1-phosphate isomerase [Candidatus Poriferisodalis sp.]|uniref:S-methyl-5-thioribose-1-phosphate isomerase n=2 Tax=Candidatus Poriferisodalis sp. TaxID=3101277 RepID=UPI003B021E74